MILFPRFTTRTSSVLLRQSHQRLLSPAFISHHRCVSSGSTFIPKKFSSVAQMENQETVSDYDLSMKQLKEKYADKIIDGTKIAKQVREEVRIESEALFSGYGVKPGLGVILVGKRPDSAAYVRMKKKAATEAGFHSVDINLSETATEEEVLEKVNLLSTDPLVHGILVQLPLPSHVTEHKVLSAIDTKKDVDGFLAENVGNLVIRGGEPPAAVACTPAGCVELLERSMDEISGKSAAVLGRSNIVGMPMAHLLTSMDATVTVCHSRTKNIPEILSQSDIIVAAIGKAEFVKPEWIKPGAVVIDVGINSVDAPETKKGYRLVGDVDFKGAVSVAGKITPVPGGVGPMTIAMLLKNTLNLARRACGLERLKTRHKKYSY